MDVTLHSHPIIFNALHLLFLSQIILLLFLFISRQVTVLHQMSVRWIVILELRKKRLM
ncbi:hypothetical protein HanIR_Chr09g0442671 [Helianthus annuus]|nr:hypothetical protein HanIR_Chr09g0442671 [Helianthus annuus]